MKVNIHGWCMCSALKLEMFTWHILQKINWQICRSATLYLRFFFFLFFHFTWAKSNEISVLKESLSTTAHNFSALRYQKKVMIAVVKILRSKGNLVVNDPKPAEVCSRPWVFTFLIGLEVIPITRTQKEEIHWCKSLAVESKMNEESLLLSYTSCSSYYTPQTLLSLSLLIYSFSEEEVFILLAKTNSFP